MTDVEYKDVLAALAEKHLRLDALQERTVDILRSELNRLVWICKLNEVVRGVPSQLVHIEQTLLAMLTSQLTESPVGFVVGAMEDAGMMDALDEVPELVFGNLRRSVIPNEDIELLRGAGIQHPEAEVTIIISHSRNTLGQPYLKESPSRVARDAKETLQQAISEFQMKQPSTARRRKLFNGIGKILTGTVVGAGNVLLACGTFIAPNPASAYTALGSAALAVGGIFQGIGDIRGE